MQKIRPLGSHSVDSKYVVLQENQACQSLLFRQVQAPLPEDPALQVQGSQMDLPVEPLRRPERPDLLPLSDHGQPSDPHMEACPRHREHSARDRLGAMFRDEGLERTYVDNVYERAQQLSRS